MASVPISLESALPDYLPARMLNEFIYCPRLFFYEWVEGLFCESVDTEEGKVQHRRVDKEGAGLPAAAELGEEIIHSRSAMLSSDRHRVIAKLDLLEVEGGVVTPVDYKHGKPRENGEGIELWPEDRMQLAVQGLILRDNGYQCEEGLVYYAKTRQRVRVVFTPELMDETIHAISDAFAVAARGELPHPLVDSPKCTGCSLVPLCLPDETNALLAAPGEDDCGQLLLFAEANGKPPKKPPEGGVRRLMAPRDDLRPLYLNTQGLRVGKSGGVLQVKEKDKVRQEVRIGEICQVNLMGNIQLSTQATQVLCEAEVPVCYFSQGGWFYGITTGLSTKNVFLRRAQFGLAEQEWFCLQLARKLVAGKIRNQRTMLLRNHVEPPARALLEMKEMAGRAEKAGSLEELLGIEGNGARAYFGEFAGMIKTDESAKNAAVTDDKKRSSVPPRIKTDESGTNAAVTDDKKRSSVPPRIKTDESGTNAAVTDDKKRSSVPRMTKTDESGTNAAVTDDKKRSSVPPRIKTDESGTNAAVTDDKKRSSVPPRIKTDESGTNAAVTDDKKRSSVPPRIKTDESAKNGEGLQFDFTCRNRRPPKDPVNALLSLAYSVLAKDLTVACYAVGFDPMMGFYHQPRFGRPALALDLMEPFRPLVADSAVLNAINTRMVTPGDFIRVGESVALTANGRKAFYRAYELRMDTLVTHPIFEYRMSYRRLLEIQARLLARVLQAEIGEYPVFVTR